MPPADAAPCILVIDDDPAIRRGMRKLLGRQGYRVELAEDGMMALQVLEANDVDIALVDRNLGEERGEELIPELLGISPTTVCIGITGQGSAQTGKRMLEAGAEDYFTKPITDESLFFSRLSSHLKQRREGAADHREVRARLLELHRSEDKLRALKGNSPAMLEMVEEIRMLAPLPVPVLIRGESGTGKELVARALHDLSLSASGPFVPVNCAAIPESLFESELFGHVKGSFTGADKDKPGLCQRAAGGTLFLDEVGELPLELQAKLLRVLEQREVRRVGAEATEPLKARVVAATNVHLEQAIEARAFRQDLYFRLSAQEIYVPPLRERRDDIHQLSFHFIDTYNAAFGRQIKRIHPDALARLKGWGWQQNNVRELDREIQRALARCDLNAEELTADMLFRRRRMTAAKAAPRDDWVTGGLLELPYKQAMALAKDRVTVWYLRHFLKLAGGNQSHAAVLAHDMQRSSFNRHVNRLKITIDEDS